MVPRIRPAVVEPQAVVIPFELEDVRIAVGVGSVRCAICVTAFPVQSKGSGCISPVIGNQPARRTTSFLFEDRARTAPQEAVADCVPNPYLPKRFQKAVTV